MRETESKWIGDIPDDWDTVRMQDVGDYKKGPFGSSITLNMFVEKEENTYKIYEQKNAIYNNETLGDYYITQKDFNTLKAFMIKPGDILVSCAGTIGKSTVLSSNCECGIINQALMRIRLKKDINKSFYLYSFDSILEYIFDKYSNGSAIKNIPPFSILKKQKIASPPLEEQKKIVEFLDNKCNKIENIKSTLTQQIEKLEEYRKSSITEAVTKGLDANVKMKDSGIDWIGKIPDSWKVCRIKDLGTYRNGLTYSPENIVDAVDGTLVFRSSNIYKSKIYYNDNVYVNTKIKPELKVKKGDILICSRNGSRDLIGKNAIIEDDISATFGAFMLLFRCENPKYMYYILNSDIFSYYLGSFFTATINQLTSSNFGNMKIVYCSCKEEQKDIVKYLDNKCSKIDEIIEIKKEQIDKIDEYKKSLIYEYVTGKKRVD